MDLFKTKMTAVDDSKVTTVEKKKVAWNTGLRYKSPAISAAQKGRFVSPETRAKSAAAQKGKFVSPETRAKISAAQEGKLHPRARQVMTPYGAYLSVEKAAADHRVSVYVIKTYISRYPKHYYYIKDAK